MQDATDTHAESVTHGFRVPRTLVARIRAIALREHRSLNKQVVVALTEHADREDGAAKRKRAA